MEPRLACSIVEDTEVEIVRSTGVSLVAWEAVAETTCPADTEMKVVSVINPMIYSLEGIGLFRSKRTD